MNAFTNDSDWRPNSSLCASAPAAVVRVGPSRIHRRTGRVESPRGEGRLRRKELALLVHLYEHLMEASSREELLQVVWRYRPGVQTRTVDQTVATLRQKIELNPDHPRFVQTVHGIGYRLAV